MDGLCRFADDQLAVRLDRHRWFSRVADAPDEAFRRDFGNLRELHKIDVMVKDGVVYLPCLHHPKPDVRSRRERRESPSRPGLHAPDQA